MDLPARQGRFLKALTGFAIANLCLRGLFTFVFFWLGFRELFAYSLISICFWIITLLLCAGGHQRAAFFLGVADLFIYSFVASAAIGWQGGFYLLLLECIPLNFYNTSANKSKKLFFCGFLIIFLIFLLSIMNMNLFAPVGSELVQNLCFGINMVGISIALAVSGYLFELSNLDVEKEILLSSQKMLMAANTDPLTDLINRRIMMIKIEQEKERVNAGEKPFSLIMIDVDNFKQINDEYGHDGGDFVLINLARMINMCLRKSDLISRWGGDEFLVLLPETPAQNGQMVADKIRYRITNSPFVYREMDIPVTVTLGVAQCDNFTGVGSSIRKADQALYNGKHAGKDKVVLSE